MTLQETYTLFCRFHAPAFPGAESEEGWSHTAKADKARAGNSSPALAGVAEGIGLVPSPPDRLLGS